MRARRWTAAAIALGVVGFVALEVPAMSLYPGGTWWNHRTAGGRFWQNYLCDFVQPVAIDGVPNPAGSALARAAMLVLAAGFAAFWNGASRFVRPAGLARPVRMLGLASAAGVVAVVLLPSDRFGGLHGAAVVAAGLPGLSAAFLAVRGLFASRSRRLASWLGASMLGFALLDFAGYVAHLAAGGLGTPLLPVLQKIALALLIAWMLSIARALAAP